MKNPQTKQTLIGAMIGLGVAAIGFAAFHFITSPAASPAPSAQASPAAPVPKSDFSDSAKPAGTSKNDSPSRLSDAVLTRLRHLSGPGRLEALTELLDACEDAACLSSINHAIAELFPNGQIPGGLVQATSEKFGLLADRSAALAILGGAPDADFPLLDSEAFFRGYCRKDADAALAVLRQSGIYPEEARQTCLAIWASTALEAGQRLEHLLTALTAEEKQALAADSVIRTILREKQADSPLAVFETLAPHLEDAAKTSLLENTARQTMEPLLSGTNRKAQLEALRRVGDALLENQAFANESAIHDYARNSYLSMRMPSYYAFAESYVASAPDAVKAASLVMAGVPDAMIDSTGQWIGTKEKDPLYAALALGFARRIESIDPEAAKQWQASAAAAAE